MRTRGWAARNWDWAGLFVLGCLAFLVVVLPLGACVLGRVLR